MGSAAMPYLEFAQRRINVDILYFGPENAGKSTNIRVLHEQMPETRRGGVSRVFLDAERVIFAKILGPRLDGYHVVFRLYGIDGPFQTMPDKACRRLMECADGFVFVADSTPGALDRNIRCFRNLMGILTGRRIPCKFTRSGEGAPVVVQWNKAERNDSLPFSRFLNHCGFRSRMSGASVMHASAAERTGPYFTLRHCVNLMKLPQLYSLYV